MPISSFQNRLWEWSLDHINNIEARSGVYEFYDSLEMIIFLAVAKNIKETLTNLYNAGFADNPCLRETTHFRVEYTEKPDLSLKQHLIVFESTSGGVKPECMK